ncbi:MAG: hypothetical protein LC689_09250 [Myxococcales bacterium]|nr:hypothetical protein [Myxococcales bacterium]
MHAVLIAVALISRLDVVLSGDGWTAPDAVLRLVSTHAGGLYDRQELDRDLARLRTLGILYDVQARVDGSRVEIDARDRWSLMPVVGLRRGGGRTTARIGATDHNAFGKLFTLYAELTSNADVPFLGGDRLGSLVYAEIPRIFGTRLTPYASWTREFLGFDAFGRSFAFERSRYAVRSELRYELTDLVTVMAGAEGRQDRYENGAAPSTDTLSALAGFTLGYVEDLVSQQRGKELKITGEVAHTGELTATAQARAYFIEGRHNLCLQLTLQTTTGASESFMFHAGGLREIRGFSDAYFAGAILVRGNAEWRADLFRRGPLIGQVAAFADGGYVGARRGAVSGLDYSGPIASAGVGVRGVVIPLARAVGRIDFATGLVPNRSFDVSFSGQQFF